MDECLGAKKIWKWTFCILALLWLTFIFSNSMKNATVSGGESTGICNWLQLRFGLGISDFFVRKLAHFTEYGILGALLLPSVMLPDYSWKDKLFPVLFLLLIFPMCDETLQMFSEGRSCEVRDVWIDFAGGMIGAVLSFGILSFVKKHRERRSCGKHSA